MINGLIKLKSTLTGEIKLFAGQQSAHNFMLKNKEYLVWSA